MIATLVVCLTVLILAYRAEPFINRLIKIKERTVDAQISQESSGPGAVGNSKSTIPPEIEAIIAQESEVFAQEDMRGVARELYAVHGDWNKVRKVME